MSKSWDLKIKGADHKVVVDATETGKDVIRVDGRTAARPLSAEELERVFAIDGYRYSLQRSGAHDFQLTQIDKELAQMPAAAFQASGKNEAVSLGPRDEGHKKLIVAWAAIAVAIAALLFWGMGPKYEKEAAKRMDGVLTYMKVGPREEAHWALPLWMSNSRTLSKEDEEWAYDHFDQWRKEKGLDRAFASFRIIDSTKVKSANPRAAIVTFEIEGQTYKALVPEAMPIRWAE